MIGPIHLIGASVIALLSDRFILNRCCGALPRRTDSTDLWILAYSTLPLFVLLTLSAAVASPFYFFILDPLGAGYLFTIANCTIIIGMAYTGEMLFTKWESAEVRSRIFGRAAAGASILAILVGTPQQSGTDSALFSCCFFTLNAVLTAGSYGLIQLFWNGIREKTRGVSAPRSYAQDTVAAALVAMVLLGIIGSKLFKG